jgi:hypothetical protein
MTNASPFKYSKETIEKAIKQKQYKWFEDKLNIVGIRNSEVGKKVTNAFDDRLTVSKLENGNWQYYEWMITTDPGKKGVLEYQNTNGVARLVPDQYIDAYAIGLHQGKYEALRQVKPVTVFRDANKDLLFDELKTQLGIFGINIHKAGVDSMYVENWSEGCQVFKRLAEFDYFMNLCRNSKQKFFTYTLIESKDII